MVRTKPRPQEVSTGKIVVGPLVSQLVCRRHDVLGADIRKRWVESEMTGKGRWLVSVVGGKKCVREETAFLMEGDKTGTRQGRQSFDIRGYLREIRRCNGSRLGCG